MTVSKHGRRLLLKSEAMVELYNSEVYYFLLKFLFLDPDRKNNEVETRKSQK